MFLVISDTCMFLGSAKGIWDAMRQIYSKVHGAAQIYQIKTKISATKEGNQSVTEYSTTCKVYGERWIIINAFKCAVVKMLQFLID